MALPDLNLDAVVSYLFGDIERLRRLANENYALEPLGCKHKPRLEEVGRVDFREIYSARFLSP